MFYCFRDKAAKIMPCGLCRQSLIEVGEKCLSVACEPVLPQFCTICFSSLLADKHSCFLNLLLNALLLLQFSKDLVVYIASVDLTFRVTTLSELLPHGFTAEDLN